MIENALPSEWKMALDYACQCEGNFSRAAIEQGDRQSEEISVSRVIQLEVLTPGIEKAYRDAITDFRYRRVLIFSMIAAAGQTKGFVIGVTGQGDWVGLFPSASEWEALREELYVRACEAHVRHRRLAIADIKPSWMDAKASLTPPILGVLVTMSLASNGRWDAALVLGTASALWLLASVGFCYLFGFMRRRVLKGLQGTYRGIASEDVIKIVGQSAPLLHPQLATADGRAMAEDADETLKAMPLPETPRRRRFPLASLAGNGESRR